MRLASRRSVTRPAALSTVRWREMEGPLTQTGDDLPGGELTFPEVLEDLTTSGVRQRPENAGLFICHVSI